MLLLWQKKLLVKHLRMSLLALKHKRKIIRLKSSIGLGGKEIWISSPKKCALGHKKFMTQDKVGSKTKSAKVRLKLVA